MSDTPIDLNNNGEHSAEQPSIGQVLRTAREDKKLKLSDIAEKTKIKRTFLEYLENDEFEKLPNVITAKGFTKVYAEVLGLNAQELGETFSRRFPETLDYKSTVTNEIKIGMTVDPRTLFPNSMKVMNAPRLNNFQTTRSKKNNKLMWRIRMSILAVVCAVGLLVWVLNSQMSNIKNTNLRQQSGLTQLDAKETPESKQQALNPNKVYINAQALNRTYISVIIDGRTIFQGNLERGDAQSWEGDQYIKIRATIPRNLRLYINGADAGVLGEESTMQEKTFYPRGSSNRENETAQ